MGLVQGQYLAMARACVTESGDIGALCRLSAEVILINVVSMDRVTVIKYVPDVGGTLIDIDRSCC